MNYAYDNTYDVSITDINGIEHSCGSLNGLSTYTEAACNNIEAYKVDFKWASGTNGWFRFCQIGIMSACDCSQTSMSLDKMKNVDTTL